MIRNIIGGPFYGKTTLVRRIRATRPDIKLVNTDDIRRLLISDDKELWKAWRETHPSHDLWKKSDSLHHSIMRYFYEHTNAILITHSPVAGVLTKEILLLDPSPGDLHTRIQEYVDYCRKNGKEWESRVTAHFSWMQTCLELEWRSQFARSIGFEDAIKRIISQLETIE